MAGNKNSGNHSKLDASIRALVIDRSWLELHSYLISKDVSQEDKIKVATVLASKSMPTELKGEVSANLKMFIIRSQSELTDESVVL